MLATAAQVGELPCLVDLVAVLFECFLIISLGYLSGRFKIVSAQAKDLNSYLTTYALPSIIFLNIAQMEFHTINPSFLICMLTAKLLVFIVVTLITLSISYPKNAGFAGALSILATQSNDFALGYPLIKSLYGDSKPEMLNYLSLMAPIQLLILNPLGIAMLEYHRSKRQTNRRASTLLANNQPTLQDTIHETSMASSGLEDLSGCYDNPQTVRSSTPTTQHGSLGMLQTFAKHIGAGPQPVDGPRSSHDWDQRRARSATPMSSANCDTIAQSIGFRSMNMRLMTLVMASGTNQARASSLEALDMTNGLNVEEHNHHHEISDEASTKSIDSLARSQSVISGSNKKVRDCDSISQDDGTSLSQRSNRVSLISQSPDADVIMSCAGRVNTPCISEVSSRSLVFADTKTPDASSSPVATKMDLNFLKALATNPLIIASIVALLVNLIHGPSLPKFVTRVSSTIAASFASPALFVVGLSMYGKFELLRKNPADLLLSSVLVLTKILVLPNLMRTLALVILPIHTPVEDLRYLVDFSFLYGLLPTAPTACIIANQYGVLTDVVSLSMLLSTIFSVPLIMASSIIINPTTTIKASVFEDITTEVTKVASVMTLTLASLTLYAFWKSSKLIKHPTSSFMNNQKIGLKRVLDRIRSNPIHAFLVLLVLGQAMIGLGGLAWYFVDNSKLEPSFEMSTLATTLSPEGPTSVVAPPNVTSPTIDEPLTEMMMPVNVTNDRDVGMITNTASGIGGGPMISDSEPNPPDTASKDTAQSSRQERSIGSTMLSGDILATMSSFVGGRTTETSDMESSFLNTFQYVSSSYGLLMVKCATICLLASIMAMRLANKDTKLNVPALLLKANICLGAIILVCLALDSDQLSHLPSEASLPSQKRSLWIRLIYNTIFLGASVPMFVFIMRSYNRSMVKAEEKKRSSPARVGFYSLKSSPSSPSFLKSRLVLSSASLASDASSVMTSNTNLDSSAGFQHQHQVNPPNFSNNPLYHMPDDALRSVVSASGDTYEPLRESGIRANCDAEVCRSSPIAPNYMAAEHQESGIRNLDDVCCNRNNVSHELDDQNNEERNITVQKFTNFMTNTEFNRCSLLVLFVLINSTHHLTSICQKLLQPDSNGTFRHVEIVNAALEFGQGLLTFLIYGTKGLLN